MIIFVFWIVIYFLCFMGWVKVRKLFYEKVYMLNIEVFIVMMENVDINFWSKSG